MASLPARQQSQRRAPSEQNSSSQSQPQQQQSPVRARSEDSQTLFLNSTEKDQQQEQQEESQQSTPQQDDNGDGEVKKCWICFADSTEDTPETSPWRDPCPCALVAHEECLLDWIADIEAPTNRRSRNSMTAPKIECPQCKSEIKLARPRNLVVDAVRGMERLGAQLITPGALTILCGTVYHSSMVWGVHSIYAVFGAEDGFRILRPLIINNVRLPLEFNNSTPREIGERLLGVAVNHLVHWRLYVGLPLITPILILSRTSLADSILPVLPILFFATQTHSPQDTFDFTAWPPSASLSFALLPYIRSAYNAYYRQVWAPKEREWIKQIRPRAGQIQPENAGDAVVNDAPPELQGNDDDENVFEVRIDGNIWDEWEDDEELQLEGGHDDLPPAQEPPPPQQAPQNEAPAQPPQQQDGAADPAPANPQQPNQPIHAHPERRMSFSPTAIAETVLGALVFPSIAGLSGELLKLALPRAWTTPPTANLGRIPGTRVAATGLLQEKWARSLVGGCLFVVLKDAVMLYVRWKMAEMHRRRRVVDYAGKRTRTGVSG